MRMKYDLRDMQNPHVRRLVVAVLAAADPARDHIIVEEIGGTLTQEAWLDRTGTYVDFRLSPGTPERLRRGVVDDYVARLAAVLPGRPRPPIARDDVSYTVVHDDDATTPVAD